jgi:hypothetical protein
MDIREVVDSCRGVARDSSKDRTVGIKAEKDSIPSKATVIRVGCGGLASVDSPP